MIMRSRHIINWWVCGLFLLLMGSRANKISQFGHYTLKSRLNRNTLPLVGALEKMPVIVLDIDGTLYDDSCGVEMEICERSLLFARDNFGLDDNVAQQLFDTYGSVIKGILETQPPSLFSTNISVDNLVQRFYRFCYDGLNITNLCFEVNRSQKSLVLTGYDNNKLLRSKTLADAHHVLEHISDFAPVVIASNSPISHVQRVLAKLGLNSMKVSLYLTPDTHQERYRYVKSDREFWDPLFLRFPNEYFHLTLLDDHKQNINFAESLGISGIFINNSDPNLNLAHGLAQYLQNPWQTNRSKNAQVHISDEDYLAAKNVHDVVAYNKSVVNQIHRHFHNHSKLSVVDFGAGVGSMITHIISVYTASLDKRIRREAHLVYIAFEANLELKPKMKDLLESLKLSVSDDDHQSPSLKAHGYVNRIQVDIVVLFEDFTNSEAVWKTKDILSTFTSHGGVDLIVGSGLADLFDPPSALISHVVDFSSIQKTTKYNEEATVEKSVLLYLPITFNGKTYIHSTRNNGLQRNSKDREQNTAALEGLANSLILPAFHHALRLRGHNLDINTIVTSCLDYGGQLLARGRSDWVVSSSIIPGSSSYTMWNALLNFLKLGIINAIGGRDSESKLFAEDILNNLSSYKEWWDAIYAKDMSWEWIAENEDLLFEFFPSDTISPRFTGLRSSEEFPHSDRPWHRSRVVFQGQKRVSVERSPLSRLKPEKNEVLISTECTMVSAGTELKVFRGDVLEEDSEEPVDVTIATLKQQAGWQYPMEYGYSLVGRVVAASAVADKKVLLANELIPEKDTTLLGKRVFAFAPHASATITSADSVMVVPENIAPMDAVFLPSIETALSLVMSAQVTPGDKVLVVGQGLVGLLTAAVLRLSHGVSTTSLTVADVSDIRLQSSQDFFEGIMNEHTEVAFVNPVSDKERKLTKDFDVVLEVSGKKAGLAMALDQVRYGGRVVIGSWYAPSDTSSTLPLGAKFHRSGVNIVTSQVSRVPGFFQDRYSKQRRFDVCWSLIRRLKPSRLFRRVKHSNNLHIVSYDIESSEEVQQAFDKLNSGQDVTVLLRGPHYDPSL